MVRDTRNEDIKRVVASATDNVPNQFADADVTSTLLWKSFYIVREVFDDNKLEKLSEDEKIKLAESKVHKTATTWWESETLQHV